MAGRRAKNAEQKLTRIRDAATALFRERGFEGTTMRDLAERADVATGTVFLYVADKRELLFLVFRERLARAVEHGRAAMPPSGHPYRERLGPLFRELFLAYEEDVPLARHFVKEQVFPGDGRWEREMRDYTMRFLGTLAGVLAEAQRAGEVRADADLEAVARTTFGIYFTALVSWLGGRLGREAALAMLDEGLRLLHEGLAPA